MDFFTVPTITFQVLYVFLVLAHDRRRIVHFNVTAHPTPNGPGSNYGRPSLSTRYRGIYFVTATASLVVSSAGMLRPWGSRRSFRLPGRPGNVRCAHAGETSRRVETGANAYFEMNRLTPK